MARVVCLSRHKGVVVQDCDVYIGRQCYMGGWKLPKSKWANPFTIKECGSAEKAVLRYREYLLSRPDLLKDLPELQGQVLGCWCKKEKLLRQGLNPACHGDVLLDLVNNL